MTKDDNERGQKEATIEPGVEYRATIRFPKKDYEFMQKLIEEGEYTNITEVVRDAVKRFSLEWRDMESVRQFMPMRRNWGMEMMPMMRRMMGQSDVPEKRKKSEGD